MLPQKEDSPAGFRGILALIFGLASVAIAIFGANFISPQIMAVAFFVAFIGMLIETGVIRKSR